MSLSECSCVSGSECTSVYECEIGCERMGLCQPVRV